MRVICFTLLLIVSGNGVVCAQEMRNLSILTGSPSGTYYRFGQDIARVIKEECGVDLKVKESKGSIANLQRLRHEEAAQLAIVQQDTLEYLKEAAPRDKQLQDIISKIRYVFPLYSEEVHLITTKSSGITELSQIAGKRVAVGDLESGTYLTATFIMLLTGLKVIPVEIAETEALRRLLLPEGAPDKIDAMFFVAGKPVRLFTEDRKADERLALVNIREPAVLQRYGAAKITPDDYPWLTHSIDTVKVVAVLMAFDFRHENCLNIGMIANRLKVNLEELQEKIGHPKWRQVDLDAALPGWERYDCVTRYLDARIGTSDGRRCVFVGGAAAEQSTNETPATAPQCGDQTSDNPIVRSLCKNLKKLAH